MNQASLMLPNAQPIDIEYLIYFSKYGFKGGSYLKYPHIFLKYYPEYRY